MEGGIQRLRNMGTLRFSLRMLELHIPWVRHVFVVTNGVIPAWLNTSSPKLKLIQHRDIWPTDRADRDLPVYNSQPIEAHMHRIPNLSERFLYFNDDMYVGRSLEKSFFFTDDGKPIMNIEGFKIDPGWCSACSPGSEMGAHMPYALSVSMIQEMQARWPEHFNTISGARCRGEESWAVSPPFHYQWYAVQSNQGHVRDDGGHFAWLNDRNIGQLDAWCHDQLSNPPDLGTINDDFEVNDTDKYERQVHVLLEFMRNMSQRTPSTFEKYGLHDENLSRILLPRHVKGTLTNVPAMLTEDVVSLVQSTLP